ncbi:S-layer homology domain-containing protein [Vallitaleaceae bacterium 9-2]
MRISTREHILLISLITFIILWVAFVYILEPQWIEMEAMRQELRVETVELERLETMIKNEEMLDQKIETNYVAIEQKAAQYFNTTPQEELILLFNDFLNIPFLEGTLLSFRTPEQVEIEGITFQKDVIEITSEGQYGSVVNVFKNMWQFQKHVNMTYANLSKKSIDEVVGQMELAVYTLVADVNIKDQLYEWYIDDLFYKEDPFAPYQPNPEAVRYIYTQEDQGLFNYDLNYAFTDIEGHYMEAEINEFLQAGYLFLDPYMTFKPDTPITRGEFIVMMDKVYGWESVNEEDTMDLTSFDDYDELGSLENAFAKAIYRGYISGIIEGYTDNTLRPRNPITYGEIEYIMNNIKGTQDYSFANIGNALVADKGVPAKNWSNLNGQLTKAEAVYLLYYHK